MFRYFPANYVWSLSVSIAMSCGAQIGEVDQISARLADIAKDGDDAGTESRLLPVVQGERGGVSAGERVHHVNGPARRSRAGLAFRVSR
jgi:hypothetical protein